ncbi:Aste57867_4076 [Aphanomyces stellatus]|uniref:Aste57867_4076 protein n=1 Tax=Aphanomyces stellatus TaxID=120398 RepID=A0A485KDB0_9STRA|nr:hypothetical protein As57867_004065 [Aphanomyces stellatus]VFT81210.1 Aste57867_4076 [Aphanomyces stellatus]
MGINSPYGSNMEKEIDKACKILDAFFDPKVDADKAVPFELLQHASGIAFLTVIKAGFIWTGKLGTGIVLSRMEDGSWSPPSGIGTAGVGFGAEIGGEMIDFMIILGSPSAVATFKKGTQLSVGAGLELAVGPVGRAGGAAVNAGGSGVSSNFTYSHAKGLFAGVGLHGSTIMVRGELNKAFYGSDVSPMQILSGGVTAPHGSCDRLYETLRRACNGDAFVSGRASMAEPMQAVPAEYGSRSSLAGYGDHRTSRSSSSASQRSSFNTYDTSRQSFNGPSDVSKDSDPRLKRFAGYKSEQEIYAQYAKPATGASATIPAPAPTATPSSYASYAPPTATYAAPAAAAPASSQRALPPIPPPAEGSETKQVFSDVINFMTTRVPYADVQVFKDNCRRFGQDQMTIDAYFFYLNSVCTTSLLRELIPKLVRLLPTHEKRYLKQEFCVFIRNGIFVNRRAMILTQEEIDACRESFVHFDKDGSGTIDKYELAKVLEAMGQKPSEEELFQMISEVDEDHSGEIEFPEFLRVIETQKLRAMEYDDESDFIDAFVACGGGPEKQGHVERRVLVQLIKKDFGLPIDIDKMLDELDTDGSGEIEYDEFKALLSQ